MTLDWIKGNLKKIILASALIGSIECKKEMDIAPIEDPINVDDVLFYPNTKILDQESLRNIIEYNDSTIVFSNVHNYSAGDFLIGGLSKKTPYGLMKKIEAVNGNILNVRNIPLEKIIQKGEISFSKKIKNDGLKSSNLGYEFYKKINEVIYDNDNDTLTIDDQIRIEGEIFFDAGLDFNAKFNNGIKEVGFRTTINGEISLDIIGNFKYNKIGRINLAEILSTPILIGTTGIVATPKINVDLNYNTDLHGDLTTGIKTGINISQETVYNSSTGWTTSKFIEPYFEGKDVLINANAYLNIGIEERLTFIINGIGGPFISTEEYLELNADINKEPWWELKTGMNVNIGVDPGLLSFAIPGYQENVFEFKKLLLQSNNYEEPVARVQVNPAEGYAPLNVAIDASASTSGLDITKYIFNFGDGEFYVEDFLVNDGVFDGKTNHIYQDTGKYNLIVEIEDVIKRRDDNKLEILVKNDFIEAEIFSDDGGMESFAGFGGKCPSDWPMGQSYVLYKDLHAPKYPFNLKEFKIYIEDSSTISSSLRIFLYENNLDHQKYHRYISTKDFESPGWITFKFNEPITFESGPIKFKLYDSEDPINCSGDPSVHCWRIGADNDNEGNSSYYYNRINEDFEIYKNEGSINKELMIRGKGTYRE